MRAGLKERLGILNFSVLKKVKNQNLEFLRWNYKKIVFTNGCFDVLHTGHLKLLNEAKRLGDLLIVGLNSDSSVRKLKGKGRPINNQKDRATLLANFRCVDYVIIYNDETPLELLEALKPDFLVKGGDYTIDQVVGLDLVRGYGGEVVIIPIEEGKSSSDILKKINDL